MQQKNNQDSQLQDELARLKAEHQRLRDEKLRTEQDVAHLSRQLEQLEAQARQEYGTSDPAELHQLLEEKRKENSAMVAEYREHLNAIHRSLQGVEQQADGEEQ